MGYICLPQDADEMLQVQCRPALCHRSVLICESDDGGGRVAALPLQSRKTSGCHYPHPTTATRSSREWSPEVFHPDPIRQHQRHDLRRNARLEGTAALHPTHGNGAGAAEDHDVQ